ncbi:MAG: flagellar hook-associated protein FlgK [Ignavibacteria bacterium]
MATSIVNNGLSGLLAAQAGILTTSHNISNASTPGYSRQQIVQTTNQPMKTGAGWFGQGTSVETVQRVYSQYLTGSVMAAQTQVGEMDAYLAQVQQIDNMLADASAGLSPALSDFYKGVQDVAANPSSIPARQSLLASAQSLAARFQSINQSLDEQRSGVNDQITSEVTLINSYTAQIAQVNQQIILAQSANSNQQPNDLLDQRDELLQKLNKEVRVTTAMQTDGTVSVFIGNGQPVVMNNSAYTLVAQPSTSDPQQTVVAIKAINGNTIELQQSLLSGGTLGGLVSFVNESLNSAQNQLGRIALDLSQQFNQQHQMGQDLNGAMGGALFSFPTNSANGMYSYMNLYANKNNTGSATLSAQILQSDYRVVFNGAAFDVYRLNGNGTLAPQVVPPAAPIASFAPGGSVNVDGVTISGTAAAGLAAGDAFTVKPGDPIATRIVADSTNGAGVGALSATQAGLGALTGDDYRIDYTGTGATGYVVTRLSDNAVLTPTVNTDPANTISFEGVTVQLGGTPNVGDSFILQPTRNVGRDITVNISDPRLIAAGDPFRTKADSTNTGTAKIDSGSMVAVDPTAIPLSGTVTLTYASATNTWALTGPAPWNGLTIPSTAFNPGQQNVIDLNGVRFTLSGTPQNGDKVYLEPNSNGISDNRNAQALGALQTRRMMEGNSATYEEAYSQIVSQIGNKTREVTVTGQAQQALANQANDAVQQLSGVNLDEEAANLIRFQQAYQASAKMIDVGSKLFDTFLSAIG